MMGLEQITDRIIADAEAEAEKLICAAKERAAQIGAECEAQLLQERAKREEKKCLMQENAERNMTAAARSVERQMLLAVENEVAKELAAEAKQRILNMSTEDYFNLLTDLYRANAEPGEWEILMSDKDRVRMPDGFIDRLCEIQKGTVLSDETVSGYGFVLRRGKVSINCTIDAVFEDKKNIIADIIAAKGRE